MPKKRKQKKTNGNVQTVEVETPKQETEDNKELLSAPAEETEVPSQPSFQIDPKMAELAERFGIPIEQIIEYAQVQDARITQLENVINQLGVKLEPVIALGEKIKAAQARGPGPTSPNPTAMPQGGGTLGQIMQLLGPVLGGGGGMDEEMANLNKDLVRMSISRIKSDILDSEARRKSDLSFAKAVQNQIVLNIAGKAAKSIIETSP